MKFLWSINAYADKKIVVAEKACPLVSDEGGVGLNTIINVSPMSIFSLQFQRMLVELDWAHECFSAVPSEQNIGSGLHIYILLSEAFEQIFVHDLVCHFGIESFFLSVVAIFTSKITDRTCWL